MLQANHSDAPKKTEYKQGKLNRRPQSELRQFSQPAGKWTILESSQGNGCSKSTPFNACFVRTQTVESGTVMATFWACHAKNA